MKTWKGIKLPEVPPAFRWRVTGTKGIKRLTLDVVGCKDQYPFVLWVWDNDDETTLVRIAPIEETEEATWMYRGNNLEEGLQLATTRVLLGMWSDE